MTTVEENTVVSDRKRAVGVFSNRQQAEQALNELKASNFPMDNVSLIARDADQDEQLGGAQMSDRVGNKDVGGATGVVGEIATNIAFLSCVKYIRIT